jgi:hypothetical protein
MNITKTNQQRYFATITVLFVLLLGLLNLGLRLKFQENQLTIIVNSLLVLFYVSALISGFAIIKSSANRPQDVVRASMLSITLKFLGYLLVLGLIIYFNKPIAKEIVGFFFIQYFLFTLVEKTFILKFLKR